MKLRYSIFALLLGFGSQHLFAQARPFRLGSGLQDHMVVQQNHPLTIWGYAGAGDSIAIRGDWMDAAVVVKADAAGNFSGIVAVPVVQRGDYKPHTIEVSEIAHAVSAAHAPGMPPVGGSSKLVLSDVLIGEVWLCSGQSNMQFSMKTVTDSAVEMAAAIYPHLRLLNVDLNFSATPIDSIKGHWTDCNPTTVEKFSAVGYYFGRELLNNLDVPVGVIFSGIGASAAQAYVPQPALAADTQLNRVYLQPYLTSPKSKEVIDGGFSFEKVTRPFLLYNAMIYPLRRMSIKGICWYQGESNRTERESYTNLTQTMISSWRQLFAQGELPFYYVQVAPFFWDKENDTLADYSFFREAQEKISMLNNTAMVTTVDVGEARDLHPHNKKPVGIRLARTALNRIYDRRDIVWRGPQYEHLEIIGKKAIVFFQPGTVAGGLQTNVNTAPAFFTIAGADQHFYPAKALIVGDQVSVWSDKVKHPVAVRYAFTNYAVTNLHNGEGWPVIPFRTDRWPEPVEKTK